MAPDLNNAELASPLRRDSSVSFIVASLTSHRMKRSQSRGLLPLLWRALVLTAACVLTLVLVVDVAVASRPLRSFRTPSGPIVVANVLPHSTNRLVGIGASGAWWSNPVYAMGARVRRRVDELLFGEKGLELSQFRFNIGGGGVGVSVPWKAPPSFYQPNGTYDYADDQSAVYFLRAAKDAGVTDLVGFANSAPEQFTSDHKSCGGTLLASDVGKYATVLAKEVRGIDTHFGVRLAYVSPVNEPTGSQAPCRQEGMAVPIAEQAKLIVALHKSLARYAPWCKIIADEASVVKRVFLPQIPVLMRYPGVAHDLAALSYHGYDYPGPAILSRVAALSAKLHKPVWATEICCHYNAGFGYQYDPYMSSGIWLANTIYNDLMVADAQVFDWWIALSPDSGCDPDTDPGCMSHVNVLGRNDGLVYFDLHGATNGDHVLFATKRYFVLGNFSRYLRPGSRLYPVLVPTPSIKAMVAVRGNTEDLVVINENPAGTPSTRLEVRFPSSETTLVPQQAVITSGDEDWGRAFRPVMSGHDATVLSRAASVTTYVFARIPSEFSD